MWQRATISCQVDTWSLSRCARSIQSPDCLLSWVTHQPASGPAYWEGLHYNIHGGGSGSFFCGYWPGGYSSHASRRKQCWIVHTDGTLVNTLRAGPRSAWHWGAYWTAKAGIYNKSVKGRMTLSAGFRYLILEQLIAQSICCRPICHSSIWIVNWTSGIYLYTLMLSIDHHLQRKVSSFMSGRHTWRDLLKSKKKLF